MKPLAIQKALDIYGGVVQFFGTNEPLDELAAILKRKSFGRILACSCGGDQVLTLMGLARPRAQTFAFDCNPAQLFVLAVKARLIADRKLENFSPSLEKICSEYRNQVQIKTYVPFEGKKWAKEDFIHHLNKYGLVIDHPTYFLKNPVFWKQDKKFLSSIRANLKGLRFLCADVLLAAEEFPKRFFDLFYLSDIRVNRDYPSFYLRRLACLLSRLKPGGLICGYTNKQYSLMRLLGERADFFGLELMRKTEKIWCFEKRQSLMKKEEK